MHWGPALVILLPSGIYRAIAWVKAEPGVRVMIDARDSFDPHTGNPSNYGVAQFDLAARSVVNSTGDIIASGVDAAEDGWVKVWVDLRSKDGQIFALIGLLEGHNNQHVFTTTDQSVIFGGFEISTAEDSDARIVAGSHYFDSTWYLVNYPDVAAAELDPAVHYASQGWRDGHNPGPAFDTRDYLAHNRDVELAGVNPLVHFVRYGAAEARMGGVVRPGATRLPPEMAATVERLASDPRPVILMLLHELGGGTEIHVRRLAAMLGTQAIFLMLKGRVGRSFALSVLNFEDGLEVELQSGYWDEVCAVLRSFDVRRVHVHHTFGFLNNVQSMLSPGRCAIRSHDPRFYARLSADFLVQGWCGILRTAGRCGLSAVFAGGTVCTLGRHSLVALGRT